MVDFRLNRKAIATIGSIALIAGVGARSIYWVGSAENAVITYFGEKDRIVGPGLGFKNPLKEATHYNIGVQNFEVKQTRPSCNANANSQQQDPGNTTYTSDQQFIYASATAQITLAPGEDLWSIQSKFPDWKTTVQSKLNLAMKSVLGTYNTKDIPSKRQEASTKIEDSLAQQISETVVDGVLLPVRVVKGGAQLGNFDFSCQYEAGVEQAAQAKNEETRKLTEEQVEQAAKRIRITKAEGQKREAELIGDGEAAKILSRVRAEAEGVRLMQEALAVSPLIVEYTKAKGWNGQLPVNMYGSAPIPFLDVNAVPRPAATAAAQGTPAPR